VRGLELGEARHEPERGERDGGGDGEGRPARPRAHRRGRRPQVIERGAHGLEVALAFVGEKERADAALEKPHAELRLERLHLPADRRLGEEELFPRLGEGQVPRGGLEALQEVERWQVAGGHVDSRSSCIGCRQLVCRRTVRGGDCGHAAAGFTPPTHDSDALSGARR
jgi:hypothetical protein